MKQNPDYINKLLKMPNALTDLRTVKYQQGFKYTIPESSGIYIIHDIRGPLYIGKSINLRRRYDEHFDEKSNFLIIKAYINQIGTIYFSWVTTTEQKLNILEKKLIQHFCPICNHIKFKNV